MMINPLSPFPRTTLAALILMPLAMIGCARSPLELGASATLAAASRFGDERRPDPSTADPSTAELSTAGLNDATTGMTRVSDRRASSQPPRPREIRYERYSDPDEQAFSFEAPEGWTVSAGLGRRHAIDVSPWVNLRSPDGQIQIFGGDPSIPIYALPSETLAWTGFSEGSWYSPGQGLQMMVASYRPAAAFLAEYAQYALAGSRCRALVHQERPDWAAARLSEDPSLRQVYSRFDAGELELSCERDGVATVVYGAAFTGAHQTGWNVDRLLGFVAHPSRQAEAGRILSHLVASFQVNPEWQGMQNGLTAQSARMSRQSAAQMSKMMRDRFREWDRESDARMADWEARQRTQDDMNEKFSEALRGTVHVQDTEMGTETEVWDNGQNYEWGDANGTIVGTELDENPDALRFNPLRRKHQ